ncbi:MAG: hypothetical protein Q8L24_00545 [bacterium]|nr:hypothetical protein [bacterium]
MDNDRVHDSRIMKAVSATEPVRREQIDNSVEVIANEEVAYLKSHLAGVKAQASENIASLEKRLAQAARENDQLLRWKIGLGFAVALLVFVGMGLGLDHFDSVKEVERIRIFSREILRERNEFSLLSRDLKQKLAGYELREYAEKFRAEELGKRMSQPPIVLPDPLNLPGDGLGGKSSKLAAPTPGK